MRIELILASSSTARASLLRQAGVSFRIEPADIDEGAIKATARESGDSAADCALALAHQKAVVVSRRNPDALVVGADQILVSGQDWFDKPSDETVARQQLEALQGRTHELVTAACVVRGEAELWRTVSRPCLMMREFSAAFLDEYIAGEGEALLGSVGAYRLEARGVQLFSGIKGDYFAVLGLPLLELLDFLRGCGALQQ